VAGGAGGFLHWLLPGKARCARPSRQRGGGIDGAWFIGGVAVEKKYSGDGLEISETKWTGTSQQPRFNTSAKYDTREGKGNYFLSFAF